MVFHGFPTTKCDFQVVHIFYYQMVHTRNAFGNDWDAVAMAKVLSDRRPFPKEKDLGRG